ncbi:ABC transporter permease [Virgisporangium ochraceum]|uniref:ABC transporter n=1 Tax=Virgisporangium ochraceum TaxID=65505 RepID=A0A8J3ZQP4_9ACTN|nr:FtsX-like permease family protein [Virgisporangium ochraceum]GIJ65795.1 ABC transporter [Virgisporangium ochraceum]
MLRAMLRDLAAHKGRLAMMLAAIVLGVGFMVATWVIADSTARSAAGAPARTDVDVAVQAREPDARFTADDRNRLAALPGVERASGVYAAHAALVAADGKLAGVWPDRAGTNWDPSQRFTVTSGRGPERADEVALGAAEADAAGLRVGDSARVILGDGASRRFTVVGLFTYRGLGAEPAPSLAFVDAPALFGNAFDRVELVAATGTGQAALADAAAAAIGGDRGDAERGRAVRTGAELADERDDLAADNARSVREVMLAFAAVALLAGMFVIANTFTMLVTQRTRQYALLRAVGASRRQVRRAVLAEAGVIGTVGSAIGAAVGVGLGMLAMAAFGSETATVVYSVSPVGVGAGFTAGVVVTLVSAWGSARRGAAVPPVAALRSDATIPRRALRVRLVVGLALFAAGVALVAAHSGTRLDETDRVLSVLGALVAWVGLLVLAPLMAAAVLRPLSRVVTRGPALRLAVRNAVRDPRRTAATASSLVVGLALVTAFAVVGTGFGAVAGDAIRGLVPASTTVVEPALDGARLSADVPATVAATPGVTASLAVPRGWADWDHGGISVSAVDPAALAATLHLPIERGSSDLGQGVVLLRWYADQFHVEPGDRVTLRFSDTESREVTVAGVYSGWEAQPGLFIDRALVPEKYRGDVEAVYATGSRAALEEAFRDRPDILVSDRDEVVSRLVRGFELVLSVIYALFGAALVIAVFGVVNTLALSVLERTREIGVLRAVGAGQAFVRRAVRLESIVITGYGGLLGVLVGLALGGVLQHVMLARELWLIDVPVPLVLVSLVGMVLVGVVAAVWPARRAARSDILAAVAAE